MRHFNGHACAVRTLANDPNFGLRVSVASQNAVGNWNRLVQRDPLDRGGAFIGHHLKVVGVAPNHGAERDQRIKLPGPGEALQRDTHFESPRHRAQEDVLCQYAESEQLTDTSLPQPITDRIVKSSLDNTNPNSIAFKRPTFNIKIHSEIQSLQGHNLPCSAFCADARAGAFCAHRASAESALPPRSYEDPDLQCAPLN